MRTVPWDMLIEQFDLQLQEPAALRAHVAPVAISNLLRQELAENVPLVRDMSTAKARLVRLSCPAGIPPCPGQGGTHFNALR